MSRIPTTTVTNSAILAEKIVFRSGKTAQNRFFKAPCSEKLFDWNVPVEKRGYPNQGILNLYKTYGEGEVGLIVTGNMSTDPTHLGEAGQCIVSKENDSEVLRDWFKMWSTTIKQHGSLAIGQVNHVGRMALEEYEPRPFSSSDVLFKGIPEGASKHGLPRSLTVEEIKTQIIDRFVFSAKFLHDTGFDGIELHSAHGMIFSQFLNPKINLRTDAYGGSLENRAKLLLETITAIRESIPSSTGFLVGIKINSLDFQQGGMEMEHIVEFCRMLENSGIDFVELTGGRMESIMKEHNERQSTKERESFFLEFIRTVHGVFKNTVVYITGGYQTVQGMVESIENGLTRGIGLARAIAHEPDFTKKVISGEVQSCLAWKFNPSDFFTVKLATHVQMDRHSQNESVIDFTKEPEAEKFKKEASEYIKYLMSHGGKDATPGTINYQPVH